MWDFGERAAAVKSGAQVGLRRQKGLLMRKLLRKKLKEIAREMAEYGEKVNNGARKREIVEFREKAAEELQADLPQEYLALLRAVNGIEYNGFIIYGIDEELLKRSPNQSVNGLIEFNKDLYENEWQKRYVFLGESSVSWYVYDLADKKYYELDNPSGTICEEFQDLESMLEKALTDALM